MSAPAPADTTTKVPCCPPANGCPTCDVLPVVYSLSYPVTVQWGDQNVTVPCEVTYRFVWKRCRTGQALGDIVHSMGLVPGESVRLQVSDSSSRWSYDTESDIATFQATTSHEAAYASQFADMVSNQGQVSNGYDSSNSHEDSVSGGGSAGLDLGFFSVGGSAGGSSHNANSSHAFGRYAAQYARASSLQVQTAIRARSSVSIGHVATRTHAAGESENHWESSSRTITNPNRCRSVSYLFHQVVSCSTVTWELEAIDRTVQDPFAPVGGLRRPAGPVLGLANIPSRVSALNSKLLDTTRTAIDAAALRNDHSATLLAEPGGAAAGQQPVPADLAVAALDKLDAELIFAGLIDEKTRAVSDQAKKDMGWGHEVTIPTNGFVIKSCLDECNACEPEMVQLYALEVENQRLQNELLKKQIEILDKSQEYRCCPGTPEAASS